MDEGKLPEDAFIKSNVYAGPYNNSLCAITLNKNPYDYNGTHYKAFSRLLDIKEVKLTVP